MQNLGKADKTTDEIFEDHLINFNTQQVFAICPRSLVPFYIVGYNCVSKK